MKSAPQTPTEVGYDGWNTQSHLQMFDLWNAKSDRHFRQSYGCFGEIRYLRQLLESQTAKTILDVGCATGTTFRYLKLAGLANEVAYTGIDLSEPALERARTLHPEAVFRKTEREPLQNLFPSGVDVVFSRDTIMHQNDPLAFVTDLCSVANDALIVRLRTRDIGPTELNVEASCQMHYDAYWMPYIVFNVDELIEHIIGQGRVTGITLNRSYEVLGGKVGRFLPKDLYFSSAGGAETSLMVQFGDGKKRPNIQYDSFLEGHLYLRRHSKRFLAHHLADRMMKTVGLRA